MPVQDRPDAGHGLRLVPVPAGLEGLEIVPEFGKEAAVVVLGPSGRQARIVLLADDPVLPDTLQRGIRFRALAEK